MKKVVILSIAVALLCTTGLVGLTMAEEKGPADITINADGKKPAIFPHAEHQSRLKCADCHHGKADDGSQVAYTEGQKVEKCATCHNKDVLAGKMAGKNKLDTLKGAGHANCKACHSAEAKKDPAKKKLKSCTTCHPKKK